MPTIEQTLHGDIDEINKKLTTYILFNCGLTNIRSSWTTEFGKCKCIFTVFEKHAKKLWNGKEWVDQPHYALSLNLIDTGEEIRLCGMTSGSGQEMYFIGDCGAEGEFLDVLGTALIILDDMIVV